MEFNKEKRRLKLNRQLMKNIQLNTSYRNAQHVIPLLAAIVTLVTFAYLILPAIALTQKEDVLDCHYEVHQHTDSCYEERKDEDGHTHKELVCGKADYVIHTHTDECYSTDDTGTTYLVCTLPEHPAHVHDKDCYKEEQVLVCDKEESENHTHDETCYKTEKVLVCDQPELHTHNKACYDEDGNLICGKLELKEHKHDKECMKKVEEEVHEESEDPADSTVDVDQEEESLSETADETQNEDEDSPVADEEAEDSTPEVYKTESEEDEPSEDQTDAGLSMPANTFRGGANGITVVVNAEEGTFPADTVMKVEPVKDKDTIDQVSDAVKGKVEEVCALDITFYHQGNEIEPKKPVEVLMANDKVPEGENISSNIVHLDDKGKTEIIDHEKKNDNEKTLLFETDAFSVYAVVYTVDFHWEVEGKKYDFSIPGGGFLSLKSLVEELDLAGEKADKDTINEFIADVENVTFSNPDLAWVGKAEKDTTVEELKESNKLDAEYSSDLSKEQTEEINEQPVEAGDWALISLQPFKTEEALTVTMKNGDRFTVKVTDDLIPVYNLWNLNGHEYALAVNVNYQDILLTSEPHSDGGKLKAQHIDSSQLTVNTTKWKFTSTGNYGEYYISCSDNNYLNINGNEVTVSSTPQVISLQVKSDGRILLSHNNYSVNLYNNNAANGFGGWPTNWGNDYNEQFRLFEVPEPSNNELLVNVAPYGGGTVSGKFSDGNTTGELKSFYTGIKTGTNGGWVNYSITAKSAKGYAFDHWELDGVRVTSVTGNRITGNSVTGEGLYIGENGGHVLTAVFTEAKNTYTITMTQEDISKGHVSYNGSGNVQIATSGSQLSITQESKTEEVMSSDFRWGKEASYTIRATTSDPDYEFDKWIVSGDGEVIEWGATGVTEESREIKPKVTGDVTLTATFKEKVKEDYPSLPYNRTDLDQWILDTIFGNTLQDVDKTAEVYDYENRIYQVDLTGKSGIRAMGSDLALGFVTDISNSMLFAESLDEVTSGNETLTIGWTSESSMADQLEAYVAAGKIEKNGKVDDSKPLDYTNLQVYATVGDNNQTATQYIIWYQDSPVYFNYSYTDSNGRQRSGNINIQAGWYAMDASYYSRWRVGNTNLNYGSRFIDLDTAKKLYNNAREPEGKEYILYTPNSSFSLGLTNADTLYAREGRDSSIVTGNNRLYYLVDSVYQALWQVNYIADTYPLGAIYAGIETFCANTGSAADHQDFVQIGGEINHDTNDPQKTYQENLTSIDSKMKSITTQDGTRQDIAIQNMNDILHWDNIPTSDNALKKYVIMITDGAPNGIQVDPAINAIQANLPSDVTLITVGLSMEEVEGGQKLLYNIAASKKDENGNVITDENGKDVKLYYSAEKGEDLTYVLMEIVRSLMDEATITGNVVDTIDEAFYPVDKNTGDTIQLNAFGEAYINKKGEVLETKPSGEDAEEYGTVTYADGKYKVTWSEQDIKPDGWHGTVYVKAKEDFLGGQGITTNEDASMTPLSYRIVYDDGTSTEPDVLPEGKQTAVPMTSPKVHVDELDFTKLDTEWTVYRDTNVDPLTQLYNLYKNINVVEVVTDEDSNHRMAQTGERVYSLTSGNDADAIAEAISDSRNPIDGKERAVIPLSEVIKNWTRSSDGSISGTDLTIDEWKQLIRGENVTRVYTEYGHSAGEIILSLSSSPAGKVSENDADKVLADPGQKAEHPASEKETYVLNVKYIPYDGDTLATGEYRTVHSGKMTDEIGSDIEGDPSYRGNKHVINILDRTLEIEKTDPAGNVIKEAAFDIYQKDNTSGSETNVVRVNTSNGLYQWDLNDKEYIVPEEANKIPGDYWAASTVYYIKEKTAPAGYAVYDQEIPVTLTIADVKEELTASNGAVLYNWTQTPSLSADSVADYVTVTPDSDDIKISVKNDKSVDITIIKTDTDGVEIPGAKFSLTKDSEILTNIKVIRKDGSWENEADRITITNGVFTIPKGGVKILGLGAGAYTLTETDPPAGFIKTLKPITFEADRMGTIIYTNDYDNTEQSVIPAEENSQYTVQNEPGAALPHTGGPGTALFYLLGSLLIIGAGVLLIRRRDGSLSC